MVNSERLICAADDLLDGASGAVFPLVYHREPCEGFVVRFRGKVYGYLNRCAHALVKLDWDNPQFFDETGLYLRCSTHGALYRPDTGSCVAGRCEGQGLVRLNVVEQNGYIYLVESEHVR